MADVRASVRTSAWEADCLNKLEFLMPASHIDGIASKSSAEASPAHMLYRLEIENFYSIRDPQVIDLTIAPNVGDPGGRYASLYPGSALRAPKVLALYGPNASGKTTVLRAIDFLAEFVRNSASRTTPGFACERFNDAESRSRPIKLALEFAGAMDLTPEVAAQQEAGADVEYGLYRYELSLGLVEGIAQHVETESLRQKPEGRGKWQRVFERAGSNVVGSKSFPISGYRHLLNTLRPNASTLSSFAQFQHPAAGLFVESAKLVASNVRETQADDQAIIYYLRQQPMVVDYINRELRRIDIGVEAMRMVESPSGPVPMFKHEGLQLEMPWLLESHGTRAFIRLFPYLANALARGGVAVIDEFDTLIHPLVLPDILRWFYDEGRNPHDAQIWLSCHSASLLEDLTKEEVILCEKDRKGRTSVFSLMDVKAIRRDENLYRKYLSGAYGAVPNIG